MRTIPVFCPEQQEEWCCWSLRSGRWEESRSRSGQQELSFGHVTFETSLGHPSGSDKRAGKFVTLLFGGNAWAKELNFGIVIMEMVFQAIRLNEVTQGVPIHADDKRSEDQASNLEDSKGAWDRAAGVRQGKPGGCVSEVSKEVFQEGGSNHLSSPNCWWVE